MSVRTALAAAFAAAPLLAACPAGAALTYVSQSRSVEATSDSGDGGGVKSAAGLGPFDAAESFDFHQFPSSPASASASQRSTLGPDAITAAGHVDAASGSPAAHYRSLVDVTFDVSQPTTYTLNADSGLDVSGLNNSFALNDVFTVLLRRVDAGAPSYLVDHRVRDSDISVNPETAPKVSAAGVLIPGRYELTFDLVTTIYSGSEDGNYSLKFAAGSGGGSGPPNAVPLPPAGYAGLLTLVGLAGGQWLVARRRRRLALDA